MSFSGYLIKFIKTDSLFPHRFIQSNTYKSTPLARSEIKKYRDNNNTEHVVVSPNYKTKIEFSTYPLNLAQVQTVRSAVLSAMDNQQIRKVQMEYWDDELMEYRTAWFRMSNLTYPVKTIKSNNIKYDAIQFLFEEI